MTSLPIRGVGEVDRRGLRDRVYDLILEMLLEGDVEPGTRLSIDTLAKDLSAINVDFDGTKLAGVRFSGFSQETTTGLIEFISGAITP